MIYNLLIKYFLIENIFPKWVRVWKMISSRISRKLGQCTVLLMKNNNNTFNWLKDLKLHHKCNAQSIRTFQDLQRKEQHLRLDHQKLNGGGTHFQLLRKMVCWTLVLQEIGWDSCSQRYQCSCLFIQWSQLSMVGFTFNNTTISKLTHCISNYAETDQCLSIRLLRELLEREF